MNDRKQLGIIRISAHGTLFEVPYFEEADFAKTVVAVRAHQGYEPAQFTMLAYGGNGPLHACGIANAIGMKKVFVPPFRKYQSGMFR